MPDLGPLMPRPRNRFERTRQALYWMEHEWPCGRPVRLRWRQRVLDKGRSIWGDTSRDGGTLEIRLSKERNRTWVESVETLAHEYTHCIQWGMARVEHDDRINHHSPAFWAQYGEIVDRWNHDNGAEESREYPTR